MISPRIETPSYQQAKIARGVGTESGEMRVSYFTLRTFVILMETIKDLYKRH
jgi:hypothetical protein